MCRVFPNCTAKPKGERAMLVGDMLPDCKEISQLMLRRPFDRVSMVWGQASLYMLYACVHTVGRVAGFLAWDILI